MNVIIIPHEHVDHFMLWSNGPYRLEPVEHEIGYIVGTAVLENEMYQDLWGLLIQFECAEVEPAVNNDDNI